VAGDDGADAEELHQCPAAGILPGEARQLTVYRPELGLQGLDQEQVSRHLLLGRLGESQGGHPLASLVGQQLAAPAGPALVVEHGVQPLCPARPILAQGPAEPGLGSQLLDLLGWDPGLRQVLLDQEQDQPARVELVGLGPPGAAPLGLGLGRVDEMDPNAVCLQLLRNPAPAGAGLDGHVADVALPALDP
jgi:hypothetical protein